MGIIKRQAIFGTIITYIAVVIGFFTVAILMPKLDIEIVGLVNILMTYALVISIIGGLGLSAITTRLFSYFRNEKNKHNGFLFMALGITMIGFAISLLIIFILHFYLKRHRESDDLFLQYFLYLIPLVFSLLFLMMLDNYYKVLYKAIRGTVLKEIVQKLGTFIAVLLMVWHVYDLSWFIFSYVLAFCIPGLILIFIAVFEKQFVFKIEPGFINKDLKKTIISVGLFGIISSATGIIGMSIDKMMIEAIMGLSDTGIYSVAFYFGAIISIPARSLIKIASAVIAESWKNNDLENIKSVYYKSTITQTIVGVFLLLMIIINLDNIMVLLTDKFGSGRLVIVLIGFAYLSDMLIGTSHQIISTSRHYKVATYILVFYVISLVVSNLILIPMYGIIGAAIATLLSKVFFNIIRILVVWFLFKLQPYQTKYLYLFVFALIIALVSKLIPTSENFMLDTLVRSFTAGVVLILFVYWGKFSNDINNQIDSVSLMIRKRF